IAEKMDIYHTALGPKFDHKMFQKYSGNKMSATGMELFYTIVRKDNVLDKLRDGSFHDELKEACKYMIFTNESKKQYLELMMYFYGFQSEVSVVNAITCINICREIGKEMKLSPRDLEVLMYGAMVHDLGMLNISKDIINAPRKLMPEEVRILRTHVQIGEELLKDRMRQEVIDVAVAHHERCDGSGYPKGLRAAQMNTSQMILQVADTVCGLTNERSFRKPRTKQEVVKILSEEVLAGKFSDKVVKIFVAEYDQIMAKVKAESNKVLSVYDRLNQNFEVVRKQFGA
ncbi:MAG: HD domain-containing protein, partial [Lachnospiraceae bacterium]|nr:HD domain-containing protein [Lachnospiraceae bacterium]